MMYYLGREQKIHIVGLKILAWQICKGMSEVGYVLVVNPLKDDRPYNVIFKGKDEGMFGSIQEVKDFLKSEDII